MGCDPTNGANAKRNATVAYLIAERRLSYSVIAEMMGISRNVVAGIAFRIRHPVETRIDKDGNRHGSGRTKIGTGFKPSTYYPEKTAWNTR